MNVTKTVGLLYLFYTFIAPAEAQTVAAVSQKEAVFIFGVSPADYRLVFYPVKLVDDSKYKPTLFTPARFTGFPEHGYVIGTAKAGESIGLLSVMARSFAYSYDVCVRTPVFTPSPGRVVYYGDIDLYFGHGKGRPLTLLHTRNDQKVREFLEESHPELAPLLTKGEFREMSSTKKCAAD